MFNQLMGNMDQHQEALKEKLGSITLEESAGDGAVTVSVNGNGQILNLTINDEKLDLTDKEQVEDLVLIAANKAIEAAKQYEKAETENLLKEMLPPGFGNLFGA